MRVLCDAQVFLLTMPLKGMHFKRNHVPLRALFLGELYADRGQGQKALQNMKKAEGMFEKMGMDYWLARTQEVLGRL